MPIFLLAQKRLYLASLSELSELLEVALRRLNSSVTEENLLGSATGIDKPPSPPEGINLPNTGRRGIIQVIQAGSGEARAT